MKIRENFPLSSITTFRIGGECKYFAEVETKNDLKEAVDFAKELTLPIFILGGGSNVLISDKSFDVLVIKLINKNIRVEKNIVVSGAGVDWDELVGYCVDRDLQGIECLSGIPGTVGATPYQNIGAYGQELSDTFVELLAYDLEKRKFVILNKAACRFGYRDSIFKDSVHKGRYIIFEVKLELRKSANPTLTYQSLIKYLNENSIGNPTLAQVREAVIEIRKQKLIDPKKIGNAGSFFKNPMIDMEALKKLQEKYPEVPSYAVDEKTVKLFAGWLIEKSGWKGRKIGEVGVSSQNALVLVNFGKGKGEEIKDLSQKIVNDVSSKFGIKLEPEVQFVNF